MFIVKLRARSGEGLSQDKLKNVASFSSWYLLFICRLPQIWDGKSFQIERCLRNFLNTLGNY